MKYLLILVPLVIMAAAAYAADKGLIDTVDEIRDEIKEENNPYQVDVQEVYRKMKEGKPVQVELPKYETLAEDQSRIMKQFDLPTVEDIAEDASCIDPDQLGDFRIYVFISQSVPGVTLKNYMADAYRLKDAVLVMRGVIGSADFLKPTQNFVTQLACGKDLNDMTVDDKCDVSRVDINPQLFSLFNIEKAPAVVFTRLSYQELMIRANTFEPVNDDEYYILRGDTAIGFALDKFAGAGADVEEYQELLKGRY